MLVAAASPSFYIAMLALLSWATLASSLIFVKPTSEFGCTTTVIDDRDRHMFLNFHNDARRSMAFGEEPTTCGNMTTGKNVYKLSWDCELERLASEHVANCPSGFATLPGKGQIVQWSSSSLFSNPMKSVATQLEKFWAAVRKTAPVAPENRLPPTGELNSFANLANGKLQAVGCAYKTCPGLPMTSMTMHCVYSESGAITNKVIYEPGPPCVVDSDCTTYPGSTCDNGLCFKELDKPDSGENLMCPNNTKMTDATRMKFLDTHNYLRSRGARGLEEDKMGGFAPKASKMLKMKYDCAIEKLAQDYADGCVYAHSSNEYRVLDGVKIGENLYNSGALNKPFLPTAEESSNLWWAELKDFGVGQDNILTEEVWDRNVGHYTQMAWETTDRLGCAIVHCSSMTYAICQYGPTGNWMGELIYSKGEPCSACPAGSTCDPAEGLCFL